MIRRWLNWLFLDSYEKQLKRQTDMVYLSSLYQLVAILADDAGRQADAAVMREYGLAMDRRVQKLNAKLGLTADDE